MITVHIPGDGGVTAKALTAESIMADGSFADSVVWIDLLRPDDQERLAVEGLVGCELPTREEMREIEASSQVYMEAETIYVTASVIARADTPTPEQGELTFILTQRHLVTQRFTEPRSVATFARHAQRDPSILSTPENAVLGLLDVVIDRVADVLELVGARIDDLSADVFSRSIEKPGGGGGGRRTGQLRDVLGGIGRAGDLVHKVRDSLASLDRLVAFLTTAATARLNKDQKARLKSLSRDLRSLTENAGFLANEVNFLLDATLGLINIEQNNIIKIFSVVAVAFLPPTLIASIYGMNFIDMPELGWSWGYLYALGMMVLSAAVPLWYFKRRGWL